MNDRMVRWHRRHPGRMLLLGRRWKAKHRAHVNESSRLNRKDKQLRLLAIKAGRGCEKCGRHHRAPWRLDFHHRDPSRKSFHIGAARKKRAWRLVLAEVKKCRVVCKNCHADLNYKERR